MAHNKRVTVEDGWCVTDNEDGSQTRARLEVDQYPTEPERGPGMWNNGVSLVRERDGYGGADLDDHDGLRAVLDRLYRMGYQEWWVDMVHDPALPATRRDVRPVGDDADREEFVRRYLRAFHDVQHVSLRHHQGYSQSDWADVWVIVEGVEEGANVDALADATWSEWDAWAKGDVYVVVSEHRTLAEAMEGEDTWSEHDYPCGGYYGDSGGRYGVAEALGVSVEDVPGNVYGYTHTDY